LILLTLTLIGKGNLVQAQKILKKGQVSYQIAMDSKDIDELTKAFISEAKLNISFFKHKTRTEYDFSLLSTIVILDGKTNEGLVLMDIMGEKYAIKLTGEQADEYDDPGFEYDIKYSDETKTILGYECKKAIATLKSGEELTIFFTPKLLPSSMDYLASFDQIKGLPLEFEMVLEGIFISFTATDITKEIDKELFSLEIPEGYTETDLESLESQME